MWTPATSTSRTRSTRQTLPLTNVTILSWLFRMTESVPTRGSLRSRSATLLNMATLRQASAVLPPEQAWSLWLSQEIVAGIMDALGPSLAGTRIGQVDVRHDGRRVVGEWVRAPGVSTTLGVIYFVHGSGFALCSPRTHRRLTSWLSRLTGLPVFAIDYRLAPRHRFPAPAIRQAAISP
jgi:epsilon-lactone hydrolase